MPEAAISSSPVKLTPPPTAQTPASGSNQRRRPSRSSLDSEASPALPHPEELQLLAEEKRQHALTRELLEGQLAARDREIQLLRKELDDASASRQDAAGPSRQGVPSSGSKLSLVRSCISLQHKCWSWPWRRAEEVASAVDGNESDGDSGVNQCVGNDGEAAPPRAPQDLLLELGPLKLTRGLDISAH